MIIYKDLIESKKKIFRKWVKSHYFQLVLFNIFMIFLFLLSSAGYFHPYFVISINFIVTLGLIASIFLLGARSEAIFFVSLIFWIFASFLKLVNISVWAERTGIYAFQSLAIGVLMLFIENINIGRKKNVK